MRSIIIAVVAAVVVGCSSAENKTPDSQKAAVTPAGAPAASPGIKLADLAGTWNMKTMSEKGDSTLVSYTMTATADTTGWSITFPGRAPIPSHIVSVGGDSIVVHVGPYESVLRKGVQVTTDGVMHFTGGKVVGTTTGHYRVKTPDSVTTRRLEGTKAP